MENNRTNNILFNNKLAEFQANKRKDGYINFEGYYDLKEIFFLYSKVLHLKSKNYNLLSIQTINTLTEGFTINQQIELYEYLIKCLISEVHIEESKKVSIELKKLKIKKCSKKIKSFKSPIKEFFRLLLLCSSYNIASLLLSLLIVLLFSTIIYSTAPIDSMAIINVEFKEITSNTFINSFLNVLLYILDFDYKMSVEPINASGVLLMIFLKCIFYLVIINYIVVEIQKKLKYYDR